MEEKCDGANTAVSFAPDGTLLLQSRGHYFTGGYRERHYALFKQWAGVHWEALRRTLGCRYIMYGEWLYAKHTVYYDALPHYFLEFDVLDRETGAFLDTSPRRSLLRELPVVSVPVLAEGVFYEREALLSLLGPSRYITGEHIACRASARIVYLETEWEQQLQRNHGRAASVPQDPILRMLARLTPPERHEAHRAEWICV